MGFDFKTWYAQNKTDLNEGRADRYKTDPAYRDRVLEQNRQSREKRRAQVKQVRGAEAAAQKVNLKPSTFKVIEGGAETMFTIGALAGALGCSVQVIRLWERAGKIPTTPHRSPKGDRLYTLAQVEELQAQAKKAGTLPDRPRQRAEPEGKVYSVRLANGVVEQQVLYRIGVLAAALGRRVFTVEQLERRGVIPRTPFRATQTKYRLYSVAMIEAVAEAVCGEIRTVDDGKQVRAKVLQAWQELHIVGAKLLKKGSKDSGKQKAC